jgi:nucleoside-diphosphate-sugar epimerase
MQVFVTGASGFIGSAVVPELIGAGHRVVGLARSAESAAAIEAAGGQALRGTIDDLDIIGTAAAESDGVIHLAFRHDIAFTGDFEGAAKSDLRAIERMGAELAGSGRPLVIASGLAGISTGEVATERDMPVAEGPGSHRVASAEATLALAAQDVRSSVVRLAPSVHGEGDHGFVSTLISIARDKGVSGYIDDGANRWPGVHRFDAAVLFRLALENAPAGSVLHGSAEEGVQIRDVAEVIGRHLDVPAVSVPRAEAGDHFGWLAGFVGGDYPASSAITRELMSWQPVRPGLIADLEEGHYFQPVA